MGEALKVPICEQCDNTINLNDGEERYVETPEKYGESRLVHERCYKDWLAEHKTKRPRR